MHRDNNAFFQHAIAIPTVYEILPVLVFIARSFLYMEKHSTDGGENWLEKAVKSCILRCINKGKIFGLEKMQ
jgi:hypothetical protein